MTGPTTTGSINAKLTIDKSAWDRSVAEAKAEARELGALSPSIKIDANVGPALAKMAEVEAVERQLAETNMRLAVAEQAVGQEQAQSATSAARLAAVEKLLAEAHKAAAEQATRQATATAASAAATDAAGDAAGRAAVKVSSVAVAEQRLETAQRSAANSASTAYIANERLNAMREKGSASALQLAVAEEAVARADRNAEAAEKKQLAAVAALNAAKSEAVRKSLEQASANEVEAKSSNNAAQAHRGRVSALGVLIALAPAILAAAAPIAAGAVGLGVAFGVMAVSGVAAIAGIKHEMEQGTKLGSTYASILGGLKGNLDQLAQTSAIGMLSSFNRSVGDINSSMPFLNRMLGDGSSLLGSIGGTALRGVLTGLQQMNPLIQQGGVELGKFVTWLFSFAGTDGFTKFIGYAQQNLPAVMQLIENLVTLAGNILAAFAPLGPVILAVLNGITGALNGLPLPVLAGLLTTAVSLAPALQIAGAAMGLFAVESQLAVPVVGVLMAALTGIVIGVASADAAVQQGTASLVSYGDAVERDNGLIGENVRLQAAHASTTKEMRDAADSLGISTKQVMQAMLGDKDAQKQVNDVMSTAIDRRAELRRRDENLTDTSIRLDNAKKTLTGGISANSSAIQTNVETYKALHDITDKTTTVTDANTLAAQQSASQYGVSVSMYQQAKDAQDKAKQSTEAQTLAMQLQGDAAGLLKQSFDELNGKSLSLEQAQTRSAGATNSVTQSFKQNGLAINGGTAAAVANQQALQSKVSADQAAAEAVAKATGKTAEGTAAYAASKEQLEKNMAAQGLLTDDVQAYINKLYDVNNFKPKPVQLEVDKAKAEADLAAFNAMVAAATQRRTTYIDIITNRIDKSTTDPGGTGSSTGGRANGSLAGGAATGGFIHAGFSASSPAYLADGGSPFVPRGTDTVPAMLTPGEIVIKRASVNSLGAGNLLEANRTGKWPGQAQQQAPPVVHVYVGNEQLDSRMYTVAAGAIGEADRDGRRRPAR